MIQEDSQGNYIMTENEYFEIQNAISNITNLTNILHVYFEYNCEDIKINPLLILSEQIKLECTKITEKF